MFLKVVLCSGDQSSGFFSVFLSSGPRAAAVCANFGIYCVRWSKEPIKFLVDQKFLLVIVFR